MLTILLSCTLRASVRLSLSLSLYNYLNVCDVATYSDEINLYTSFQLFTLFFLHSCLAFSFVFRLDASTLPVVKVSLNVLHPGRRVDAHVQCTASDVTSICSKFDYNLINVFLGREEERRVCRLLN